VGPSLITHCSTSLPIAIPPINFFSGEGRLGHVKGTVQPNETNLLTSNQSTLPPVITCWKMKPQSIQAKFKEKHFSLKCGIKNILCRPFHQPFNNTWTYRVVSILKFIRRSFPARKAKAPHMGKKSFQINVCSGGIFLPLGQLCRLCSRLFHLWLFLSHVLCTLVATYWNSYHVSIFVFKPHVRSFQRDMWWDNGMISQKSFSTLKSIQARSKLINQTCENLPSFEKWENWTSRRLFVRLAFCPHANKWKRFETEVFETKQKRKA